MKLKDYATGSIDGMPQSTPQWVAKFLKVDKNDLAKISGSRKLGKRDEEGCRKM
jgi:hypothetical protein